MWTIIGIFLAIIAASVLWICWEENQDDNRCEAQYQRTLNWYKDELKAMESSRDSYRAQNIDLLAKVDEVKQTLQTSAKEYERRYASGDEERQRMTRENSLKLELLAEKNNQIAKLSSEKQLAETRYSQSDAARRELETQLTKLELQLTSVRNNLSQHISELSKYAVIEYQNGILNCRPIQIATKSEVLLTGYSVYQWAAFGDGAPYARREVDILALNMDEAKAKLTEFCKQNQLVEPSRPGYASLWPKCIQVRTLVNTFLPLSVDLAFGSHVNCSIPVFKDKPNVPGPTDSAS